MKVTRRTTITFTTTEVVETRTIGLDRGRGRGFCSLCGHETEWVEIEDIPRCELGVADHFHGAMSKHKLLLCVGALENSDKEKNDE